MRKTAFVAGGLAFLVYLLTLAPDLTWENFGVDGGELITASITLGVPHPPGYPTYVLLGKLFGWLPVGSVVYRFNLFSAVAAALAAGFVSAISFQTSPPGEDGKNFAQWPLVSGLAFAFAPLVWGQAIITEVYGLNLALLAAFLWSLLARRPAWVTGLLLGLSFTTHLSSGLMLPLALGHTPRQNWARLGLGLGLGLSPLLILPWLAQNNSPIVWGDATTLRGWWWLVNGRLYHDNLFNLPLPELEDRLGQWGAVLLGQFTWAGLPLLGYAFYRLERPLLPLRLSLLGTAVLYFIYAFGYRSHDAIVFTLPALLLLAILLAPGLRRLGWWAWFLPLTSVLLNFRAIDLSSENTVRPLAEQIFQATPATAILVTPGDQTIFSLWYYQHVEGQRADIILVDENLFGFDWYRRRLGRLYPDLRGLETADLGTFQSTNSAERPFCRATLQPVTIDDQPECKSNGSGNKTTSDN